MVSILNFVDQYFKSENLTQLLAMSILGDEKITLIYFFAAMVNYCDALSTLEN